MVTGHRNSPTAMTCSFSTSGQAERRLARAGLAGCGLGGCRYAGRPAAATGEALRLQEPLPDDPLSVRSPAEQDVINSFQAIEKAAVVMMPTDGRSTSPTNLCFMAATAPLCRNRHASPQSAARSRTIPRSASVKSKPCVSRLRRRCRDDRKPCSARQFSATLSRRADVVKRNGQWQMVISVQTEIKRLDAPFSVSLQRFDAEIPGIGRDRGTLLVDRLSEFLRTADIEELPVMVRRSATVESGRTMSAVIRSRSSSGIPAGPNNPTRPSTISAGKPASAAVGTSGRAGARTELVTAIILILPASICGCTIAIAA